MIIIKAKIVVLSGEQVWKRELLSIGNVLFLDISGGSVSISLRNVTLYICGFFPVCILVIFHIFISLKTMK